MIDKIRKMQQEIEFSGTLMVKDETGVLTEAAFGHANRAVGADNKISTRFGIASGCKIFTAVAVCQLAEAGKLKLDDRIKNLLDYNFPYFDDKVTVHHLLTHTSGVPDYFDEAVMDDFEELWEKTPVYLLRSLEDFLPLFQNGEMMFNPGDRFHYNNGGYILLGLIVESVSGMKFVDFIEQNVFGKAGMERSGYFELDRLPEDTANGYIQEEDGKWRTNIYSIPVKGGADGGAFTTAGDIIRFWEALTNFELLDERMTGQLFTLHAHEDEETGYGYGLWMNIKDEEVDKYYIMGFDPGVNFLSVHRPDRSVKVAICSNHDDGAFDIFSVIEENL